MHHYEYAFVIPDGYNISHTTTEGRPFVYRPVAGHVRAHLGPLLSDMPDVLYRKAVKQLLCGQIVAAAWEDFDELTEVELLDLFTVVTAPTHHEENLYQAARLAAKHPHLAEMDGCESCRAWWWNPLTGRLHRDNGGNPVRRLADSVLLCQTPQGCPKGTFDSPVMFTPRNKTAYHHFLIGGDAADELVRLNWSIIRKARADAV